MDERPRKFTELRGGTGESPRNEGNKPRSAASYCAQYGIPLEDIESEIERGQNHTDMIRFCEKYATDPVFRERSQALLREPMKPEEELSERDRQRLEEFRRSAAYDVDQARRAQLAIKAGAFGQPGKAMPDVTAEEINAEEYRRGMEWTDK